MFFMHTQTFRHNIHALTWSQQVMGG
jgi:hypothetical protein